MYRLTLSWTISFNDTKRMNEIIATPLVYIVWGLMIILLIASWISRTHRDLLLILALVVSIPAPFLTQSLHVGLVEPTPTPPPVSLRIKPQPTQNIVESSPMPVAGLPTVATTPVIKSKQTFTQAAVGLNYGYNPKPKYPSVARSQGWEGKVVLRVIVSDKGHSEQVTVVQSSGHNVLDDAAIAAVEGWRFVPAKRGDTAIASTVNIPINFKLDN
jgi:TonB family protein